MTANPAPGPASLFLRDPRLSLLVLVLVFVSGLSAFELLPRREDPELTGRFATVVTRWPGASAERIEALVTDPLESELAEVREISLLESDSRAGISTLILELGDQVSAVDEVWSRVRDRLSDALPTLPPGASVPDFDAQEVDAKALVAAVVWNGAGEAPLNVLARLAEELEDRLRALPGTAETDVVGAPEEEVLVRVDPARLAALSLDVPRLAAALAAGDAKGSAGRLHAAGAEVGLEVRGEFDRLERVRDTVLRSGPDGQLVRLRDVAEVVKQVAEPARSAAWIDGRRGIAVGAILERSTRVDRWAAGARRALEQFGAGLSGAIAVEVLFDQSGYTAERLDTLLINLGLGALLVVLTLWVLMGARSALLVGSALPLVSLMVLAGMQLLDIPIHQMSVTGLIIALGLLIDNAIVAVDEVRHELAAGHTPTVAVERSVRRLWVPLFGSTLTTVLAFMPIVLMPGPAGEFVGAIGLTVSLALVSSLFVSLTLIPAFAGWGARGLVRDEQASTWRRGLRTPGLEVPYRQFLRATLQRPWLGVGLSLALPVAGFAAATTLDEQFFPPADRDQFQVQLWLPQQSTLEQTSAAMAELRRVALTHPQVRAVHAFVGASAPKFYYNIPEGTEGAPYYAQALVQLHGNEGVPDVVRSLQRELDLALPAAQVVVRLLEQGPPFDAPLEVRVVGPDLDQLDRLGRELRAVLAAVPGVVHTRATLDADRPKLWLEPRDADLAPAGWDRVSLAQTLEAALEGRTAGSLLEATEELPVRVRLGADQRGTLEQILSLPLATPGAGAGWTPLGALATVRSEPELGAIRRRDRERENTVQGYLEAGILPSVGLARFRAQLDRQPVALPDGYRLEIGGESAERDDAVGNLLAFAGILLVMMGASQVLAFRSFRAAAIIGVVGFLSVGLALLALWAFQYPFGFMAIIGTMGLIGVAINDSIVVLSALRADPSAAAGDAQACERVVLRATRHVLATTATTMAGFTPLVLSGGLFWPPLAVALGFGVVGSTLLGLFFVPSVHRWSVRRWSVRRA